MPFFATKWRWNLKTISIVSHDKFATKFASRINKEKERKDIPIVFQKEKGFFKKTSIFLHTCVSHTCLSLLTFHPKVAFHIRLILSRQRESRSKIKFVAGNWRKKKKKMASLTKLFHISRCTHRYTTLVCLWTSWGKFRFPSGFRMPRRYPVHRAIMSPWWTIKYTHVCREWKGWGGGGKRKGKGWKFRGLPFERNDSSPVFVNQIWKELEDFVFFLGGSSSEFCVEICVQVRFNLRKWID